MSAEDAICHPSRPTSVVQLLIWIRSLAPAARGPRMIPQPPMAKLAKRTRVRRQDCRPSGRARGLACAVSLGSRNLSAGRRVTANSHRWMRLRRGNQDGPPARAAKRPYYHQVPVPHRGRLSLHRRPPPLLPMVSARIAPPRPSPRLLAGDRLPISHRKIDLTGDHRHSSRSIRKLSSMVVFRSRHRHLWRSPFYASTVLDPRLQPRMQRITTATSC